MGITSSNLGSSVNFAVATTLDAINATMFEYLSGGNLPLTSYCWIQSDPSLPPTPISLQDLMDPATPGGTNGTNPFTLQNWTTGDPASTDITNMENSNFYAGIQMQLGLPPGMAMPGAPNPGNLPVLPPVLSLSSSNTNTAIFNLLCAQFQVVYSTWFHNSFTFTNTSQPYKEDWVITLNVPLSSIFPPPGSDLPANVVAQLNNYGPDLFSIQQLFLDFSSAVFTTVPTFTNNFPPTIANLISPAMIQQFFEESEENYGLSVLGYSIKQDNPNLAPSTLSVGSLTLVFD